MKAAPEVSKDNEGQFNRTKRPFSADASILATLGAVAPWECNSTLPVNGQAGDVAQSSVVVSAKNAAGVKTESQAQANLPTAADQVPAPTLRLRVEVEASKCVVTAPEDVNFKIHLKNEGTAVLHEITMEEVTNGVMWPFPPAAEVPAILKAGAEWEYRYIRTISGQAGDLFRNFVFVIAKDVSGAEIMAQAKATVHIIDEKLPV